MNNLRWHNLFGISRCFHYKRLQNDKWKAYINIFVLVVFWLVFISLVVSYGKIALKLLRISQEKPDLPNVAHYTQTAKKSFFILFVFTVCFVPYHMVRVLYIKTQITETPCYWQRVADIANEVALVFSALNSCLDPVMYFLLSSSVRNEVLRLVSHVFCLQDVAGVSGSSSTDKEHSVSLTTILKKKAAAEWSLALRQWVSIVSNINTTGIMPLKEAVAAAAADCHCPLRVHLFETVIWPICGLLQPQKPHRRKRCRNYLLNYAELYISSLVPRLGKINNVYFKIYSVSLLKLTILIVSYS